MHTSWKRSCDEYGWSAAECSGYAWWPAIGAALLFTCCCCCCCRLCCRGAERSGWQRLEEDADGEMRGEMRGAPEAREAQAARDAQAAKDAQDKAAEQAAEAATPGCVTAAVTAARNKLCGPRQSTELALSPPVHLEADVTTKAQASGGCWPAVAAAIARCVGGCWPAVAAAIVRCVATLTRRAPAASTEVRDVANGPAMAIGNTHAGSSATGSEASSQRPSAEMASLSPPSALLPCSPLSS